MLDRDLNRDQRRAHFSLNEDGRVASKSKSLNLAFRVPLLLCYWVIRKIVPHRTNNQKARRIAFTMARTNAAPLSRMYKLIDYIPR